MENSRIALYSVIALVAIVFFYFILVAEPGPDSPLNLIHLLIRH